MSKTACLKAKEKQLCENVIKYNFCSVLAAKITRVPEFLLSLSLSQSMHAVLQLVRWTASEVVICTRGLIRKMID